MDFNQRWNSSGQISTQINQKKRFKYLMESVKKIRTKFATAFRIKNSKWGSTDILGVQVTQF